MEYIFQEQYPQKYWAQTDLTIPVSTIKLTTDCATRPSHFGLLILFLNEP